MTITCSHCDTPYLIVTDDTIVACPFCGTRTFSPGADDPGEEDDAGAAWATARRQADAGLAEVERARG